MDIKQTAEERFRSGFNCAETTFMAGAEMLGKSVEPAVMTAFGAGMGRNGHMCGAITGAIAAIGVSCGRTDGKDKESKEKSYSMVSQFLSSFQSRYGNVGCSELCGYDLTTQDGIQSFVANDTHKSVCNGIVLGAIDILGDLLKDQL